MQSSLQDDDLDMSEEDRINIRTLMLLVNRFQKTRLGEKWDFWYDIDLATCLQNNKLDISAATAITIDLHGLEIITLSDLGKLTRDNLDRMQWADTTKKIIWRLSIMVRRFPDKRAQTVSPERGAEGVVHQDMKMAPMVYMHGLLRRMQELT